VQALRQNLTNVRLADRAMVILGDARRVIARAVSDHGPFAVIFLDPPYDDREAARVAATLLTPEALARGGTLVLQHSRRGEVSGLPEPARVRRFGETALSFYSLEKES
jgi:16S rRNA G966 N2-methylase RsmD